MNAPAVVNRIQPVMGRIHIIQLPVGIKVHAHVHGHTVIHVILDIMAVGPVVHHAPAVIHTVAAMVQVYPVAINHVRVHAHHNRARQIPPVVLTIIPHRLVVYITAHQHAQPQKPHVNSHQLHVPKTIVNLGTAVCYANVGKRHRMYTLV